MHFQIKELSNFHEKKRKKKKILFVRARKSYPCKIEKYIVLSYERYHESAQRERERERRRSRRGGRRIKRINNRSDLYAGDHGRQASGGEGVQRPEPHNRRPQSKRQLGDSWSKAQG